MNHFGSNMAYLRKMKHLCQKDIAIHIGCTTAAVANYEAGKREPQLEVAVSIARYFEKSLEEMVLNEMRETPILFGKNLRYLRKKEGYDQKTIGDLIGVQTPTVSKYESGMVQPSLGGMVNLAEFFGISTDDLLKKDLEKEGF